MRLSECLVLFREQNEANGRSVLTLGQHQRSVSWLIRVIGDRDVDEVKPEDVARFLNSDLARKTRFGFSKSAATANCLRSSLRMFFRFAFDGGYAQRDAGRLIRRARCAPAPPRGLSELELARLDQILVGARSLSAKRDRALICVLLGTGARLGSVLAADVTDVDFERRELQLNIMKAGRRDFVYLNDDVVSALRHVIDRREDGPIFTTECGSRLGRRYAQRAITNLLRAAGARSATSHSLRHTFARRVLARSGDVTVLAAAMCHRSLSSSAAYLQVDAEKVRAAVS